MEMAQSLHCKLDTLLWRAQARSERDLSIEHTWANQAGSTQESSPDVASGCDRILQHGGSLIAMIMPLANSIEFSHPIGPGYEVTKTTNLLHG